MKMWKRDRVKEQRKNKRKGKQQKVMKNYQSMVHVHIVSSVPRN